MDILKDAGFFNTDGEFGKQILQDLILPETHKKPEVVARYARFGKRIHWIDDSVIPGAFQMNTSWYYHPNTFYITEGINGKLGVMKPHVHDSDEILAFYGSDPGNPYDLGGEVILYVNNEKHIINKSSLVFLPGGMPHCPLVVTRVDRPIFHFSIVMEKKYAIRNEDGYQVAK